MLVKTDGGYKIKSHVSGKVGKKEYPDRKSANKRIAQMEMFKMMKKPKEK